MASSLPRTFLPPKAYGRGPYEYTRAENESNADIPLGLKYKDQTSTNPYEANFFGSFEPSKLSEDAINFLKQKTQKEINVKPINSMQEAAFGGKNAGLMGLYEGRQLGETPNQRTIFINSSDPGAGLGTLFHEAGHSVDSDLDTQHTIQRSFNPEFINSLTAPSERLKYLFNTTGFPKVVSETEAQRFAGESLNEFAKQQQNSGQVPINPKTFTDKFDYKMYPGSYASSAVEKFFENEFRGNRAIQEPLKEGSDTYDISGSTVFNPNNANKGLSFGLDPKIWQTQDEIMQKTRDYIDPRLDKYMTNPTPASSNYWQPN